jgi:hypothetical protein
MGAVEKGDEEEIMNGRTSEEMEDTVASEQELAARRKLVDAVREIRGANAHTSGSFPSTEEMLREGRER